MKRAATALAVLVLTGIPAAALAAPAASPVGYDISYPQCAGKLPANPAFGFVGVNEGIVFSPNPCLAAQYQWALTSSSTTQAKVQFYANTGNPGPALSSHWPTGQQTPKVCDGSWSAGCAYDYGWNAAQDSFADAVAVAGPAASAAAPWWLDVESANSWSTDRSLNSSAIQGAVAYFTTPASGGGAGVSGVGIYSNASSWTAIVGNTSTFASYPSWVPGARTLKAATANCATTVTGGRAKYAQYASGGFDADHPCF